MNLNMRKFYYLNSDLQTESNGVGANSTFIIKPSFNQFPSAAFTVSAWVQCLADADRVTADKAVLMSYNEFTDPEQFPSGNTTRLIVKNLENLEIDFDGSVCTTGVSFADGAWNHLAIVVTFPTSTQVQVQVYKNGDLRGSGIINRNENQSLPNSSTLNVGIRNVDAADESFTGLIAQFQLWQGARTQADIRSDMFLPAPRNPQNLAVFWTFAPDDVDAAMSVVQDRSSQQNHGTIYGNHQPIWMQTKWVNVSGQDLSGWNLDGADFAWAVLCGTKLTSANLSGANLQNANLQGAILTNSDLTNAQMQGTCFDNTDTTSAKFSLPPAFSHDPTNATSFVNATLDYNVLGKNWSYLNLSQATFINLPLDLSDLQAVYTLLKGFTQLQSRKLTRANFTNADLSAANLIYANLSNANFTNATLTAANLSRANLTGATLQNAFLYGTQLSYATLDDAKLKGAQLGSAQVPFTLLLEFQESLDQAQITDALRQFFAQKNMKLSAEANLTVQQTGHKWLIIDGKNKYDIINQGTQLNVYPYLTAAVLANAMMRNAVFTNANLYAANLSGVQWYGSGAAADGANLEEVDLSNANLGSMNFSQTKLYGATLDYAILINANLQGAHLTASASNKQTSLASASLQGCNLTAAELGSAVLTNAAIALENGVPLFRLDSKYGADLDHGKLSPDLLAAFTHNGYTLDVAAAVDAKQTEPGRCWLIQNGSGNPNSLSQGYATFKLVNLEAGIQVYGASLWITRIGDGGELETVEMPCKATQLSADVMNDSTVCPNGEPRSAFPANGLAWEAMMTAKNPPAPPACAGSLDNWCPA